MKFKDGFLTLLNKGFYYLQFIAIVFISSCDEVRFYERYSDIPDHIWHYQDSVPFNFQINDTNSTYNLFFNIRHTGYYKYRNIWINVHLKYPSGNIITNKYEFALSEPSGKWFGQGIGGIYDAQFPLMNKFFFNETGDYTVYIQHLMRDESLNEVMNVGIRVDMQR